MKTIKKHLLLILLFAMCGCRNTPEIEQIVYSRDSDSRVVLAARELRRYIYIRTGRLVEVAEATDENRQECKNSIILSEGDDGRFRTDDDFSIISASSNLLICGASPVAVLYGTYQYIENALGIGFELQGDIIPDEKLRRVPLSGFDELHSPTFALRGILPFHDFPEGPDYWTEQDYQAIITQLPKMRMNFFGLHTYSESEPHAGWGRAEPNVWVGLKEDVSADGSVTKAYPVMHANTNTNAWDYYPKKTSTFSFGAAQLFDTDVFGSDYMKGTGEWPHSEQENIRIFNEMGALLDNTFTLAGELGVKTCLGTEIPLNIPQEEQKRLRKLGKDPQSMETVGELYEGLFTRIMRTHPLDYYWFWTPEGWTWQGENHDELARTEVDILTAKAAAEKVGAKFQLATCGWVLGPKHDRTAFDNILPKSWPFSCINRQQGFTPVEPGFKDLHGRPKWEITWVEDDPGLTIPQLWAGRVRKDALDAYRYGCDGLMGIHWRTMALSPAFKALSDAGWNASAYGLPATDDDRDYPVDDLYRDWATKWFGKDAGLRIANLFIRYDGGFIPRHDLNTQTMGNLPRPADWVNLGPGGVLTNHEPWEKVSEDYAFVDEFASYAGLIEGEGARYRFDYWLNTFRYLRQMGETGCLFGEMERVLAEGDRAADPDEKAGYAGKALAVRERLAESWGRMVTFLLQTVNTKGEMGTVANLEQLNLTRNSMLTRYDERISALAGAEIPPLVLPCRYSGIDRLVVTTRQSVLKRGDNLRLQTAILANEPVDNVTVLYKSFDATGFKELELRCIGGNVYEGYLPYSETDNDELEYYYRASCDGRELQYPATAPNINLNVIYYGSR
jgi:hypothetical protein